MEDQKDYIKKWYIIHTYAGYEKSKNRFGKKGYI